MVSSQLQSWTWLDLMREEPGLAALEAEIQGIKAEGGNAFCANAIWFGYGDLPGFKPRLVKLVGWGARNRKLASSEAYDLAYRHLYELLPDCGHVDWLC